MAALAADNYLGKYCIGKIFRGSLRKGQTVKILQNGTSKNAKIDRLFTYKGLGKEETELAIAGDIVALTGVSEANIGDTIATGDVAFLFPIAQKQADFSSSLHNSINDFFFL